MVTHIKYQSLFVQVPKSYFQLSIFQSASATIIHLMRRKFITGSASHSVCDWKWVWDSFLLQISTTTLIDCFFLEGFYFSHQQNQLIRKILQWEQNEHMKSCCKRSNKRRWMEWSHSSMYLTAADCSPRDCNHCFHVEIHSHRNRHLKLLSSIRNSLTTSTSHSHQVYQETYLHSCVERNLFPPFGSLFFASVFLE